MQNQPICAQAQVHTKTALERLQQAIELLSQEPCNKQALQKATGHVMRAATAMKRASEAENTSVA